MPTANASLLTNAMDAFWSYLEGKTDFTSLGLQIFKGYDGNVLPVREDGSLEASDLPAMYVESITPNPLETDTTPDEEIIHIEMEGGVVYDNTTFHTANSSVDCAAALMTLSDVILSRHSLDTNLGTGSGGAVDGLAWEVLGMDPVRSGANPRDVLYWDGQFKLTLEVSRTLPANTT